MSFPLNKKIKNPINTKIIDIRKLNLRPIKEIKKQLLCKIGLSLTI